MKSNTLLLLVLCLVYVQGQEPSGPPAMPGPPGPPGVPGPPGPPGGPPGPASPSPSPCSVNIYQCSGTSGCQLCNYNPQVPYPCQQPPTGLCFHGTTVIPCGPTNMPGPNPSGGSAGSSNP